MHPQSRSDVGSNLAGLDIKQETFWVERRGKRLAR
jgi:hypothetical protein